ncbi:uncharacterized protein EV420DRAFT_1535704 [Desarmillaria tabescens]|uniref:Uncharacterized protein n=1 Tax=Armillaria tabescens TaxID=1929756 RepID=A0AA39KHZ5_ARMTA|nr:uncharacterized protein EV420DRAFT_1535704 [Desarmillaria tabescens]KAK0460224.1 hypothetical protein EV420DRAFT_1535704 [Desarmillaria tabescens]
MAFLAASTVFTAICPTITCNQFQASQAIRSKTRLVGENAQTPNYCEHSGTIPRHCLLSTTAYLRHDYPQEWNIPGLTDSEVYIYVGNSKHYALNTKRGISEWNRLLPRSGGMVHLGHNRNIVTNMGSQANIRVGKYSKKAWFRARVSVS